MIKNMVPIYIWLIVVSLIFCGCEVKFSTVLDPQPGDVWIWKCSDPFEPITRTNTVLQVSNDWVQYSNQFGIHSKPMWLFTFESTKQP